MKLQIFYSVQNGGDGSAYPMFVESQQLANFDQDNMDEGWGENCSGVLEFESDSPIKFLGKVTTKESYLFELLDDYHCPDKLSTKAKKFVKAFFPKGVPDFAVRISENKATKGYKYNNILIGGVVVTKIFTTKEDSGPALEARLKKILAGG